MVVSKKRKRKKKKKNLDPSLTEAENPEKKVKVDEVQSKPGTSNPGSKQNNKKQKKKSNNTNTNSAIQINKMEQVFKSASSNAPSNPVIQRSQELAKISNERLKAYGVNPLQFKKKLKTEVLREKEKNK